MTANLIKLTKLIANKLSSISASIQSKSYTPTWHIKHAREKTAGSQAKNDISNRFLAWQYWYLCVHVMSCWVQTQTWFQLSSSCRQDIMTEVSTFRCCKDTKSNISGCKILKILKRGQGHSYWKVVWWCAALKISFFMPLFNSGDPLFLALFQLHRPHFYFLKKNLTNFCRFWLNFSSWDIKFSKNLFWRPQFQAQKLVLETLLLKTWAAHNYPNLRRLPPPG